MSNIVFNNDALVSLTINWNYGNTIAALLCACIVLELYVSLFFVSGGIQHRGQNDNDLWSIEQNV